MQAALAGTFRLLLPGPECQEGFYTGSLPVERSAFAPRRSVDPHSNSGGGAA